jgi:hypothetical protein
MWHLGGNLATQGVQPLDRKSQDTRPVRDIIPLESWSIDISDCQCLVELQSLALPFLVTVKLFSEWLASGNVAVYSVLAI